MIDKMPFNEILAQVSEDLRQVLKPKNFARIVALHQLTTAAILSVYAAYFFIFGALPPLYLAIFFALCGFGILSLSLALPKLADNNPTTWYGKLIHLAEKRQRLFIVSLLAANLLLVLLHFMSSFISGVLTSIAVMTVLPVVGLAIIALFAYQYRKTLKQNFFEQFNKFIALVNPLKNRLIDYVMERLKIINTFGDASSYDKFKEFFKALEFKPVEEKKTHYDLTDDAVSELDKKVFSCLNVNNIKKISIRLNNVLQDIIKIKNENLNVQLDVLKILDSLSKIDSNLIVELSALTNQEDSQTALIEYLHYHHVYTFITSMHAIESNEEKSKQFDTLYEKMLEFSKISGGMFTNYDHYKPIPNDTREILKKILKINFYCTHDGDYAEQFKLTVKNFFIPSNNENNFNFDFN